MTHEDFAHICLQIKDGDVSVEIPCCAHCEYYVNGILDNRWVCIHPNRLTNGKFACIVMQPQDFCSCYKERKND